MVNKKEWLGSFIKSIEIYSYSTFFHSKGHDGAQIICCTRRNI